MTKNERSGAIPEGESLAQWYESVRADPSFRPRLISGSPKDRLAGLEPLLAMANGARILDIGCHKGFVAYEFAKHGAALIHGLDHSPGAIETARSLAGDFPGPHVFEVFDLRGGAAALEQWIAKVGSVTYDIVLYLGVQHHLERQMPAGELDALVECLANRAVSYFAVRTPDANMKRVDALVRFAGFTPKHQSELAEAVGLLRIYARAAEAGLRRPPGAAPALKSPTGRQIAKLGLPDEKAVRQYRDLREWIAASDVCFLSISKSGRTWVRYFLQKYFGTLSGHEFDMRPRTMPRTAFSPSLCFSADFLDFYEREPGAPRIILGPEMRGRALVLMVRDPRDVVISYYHFMKAHIPADFQRLVPSGSLDEFIESPVFGLELISAFHLRELAFYAEHPGPKLLLRYEDLWRAPAAGFAALLRFLGGGEIDTDSFAAALDAARFEAMQEFEIAINKAGRSHEYLRLGIPGWTGDMDALKVRRGGAGGFRAHRPDLAEEAGLTRYPQTLRVLREPSA